MSGLAFNYICNSPPPFTARRSVASMPGACSLRGVIPVKLLLGHAAISALCKQGATERQADAGLNRRIYAWVEIAGLQKEFISPCFQNHD